MLLSRTPAWRVCTVQGKLTHAASAHTATHARRHRTPTPRAKVVRAGPARSTGAKPSAAHWAASGWSHGPRPWRLLICTHLHHNHTSADVDDWEMTRNAKQQQTADNEINSETTAWTTTS